MDDGWETRRRRGTGNDWVRYRLTEQSVIRAVEIDTGCLKGNAAGWAALSGRDGEHGEWTELLPRTRLQPDTVHRFLLAGAPPATHVRIDIFPDGGIARLRLHGSLTEEGARRLGARHVYKRQGSVGDGVPEHEFIRLEKAAVAVRRGRLRLAGVEAVLHRLARLLREGR